MGLINRSVRGQQIEIGKIDLMKSFTFVEVASEQAHDVIKAMKHGVTVKGRSVVCDVADKTASDKEARGKSREERAKKRTEYRVQRTEGRSKVGTLRAASERQEQTKEKRKTENGRERSSAKRSSQKTPPQQHHYTKDDWMKFLHPDTSPFKGEAPDFSEEGWARRKPKKKK